MAEPNYLDGAENAYGLPTTMPAGLGETATTIVNTYLKRPQGVVYVADKNGNPAYMEGMQPSFTYTIPGGVPAGTSVAVTVTPAIVKPDMIGEVLILDRGNPDLQEAVVVQSTSGTNQITFASVQFTHAANVKGDVGCVICEERSLPSKRSIARFCYFPMVNLLSIMGRYGYGRRSDQTAGLYEEMNLLASVQTFGGPPQWVAVPVSQTSWSNSTKEIWIPAGMLLAYYSDVKLRYVAGWPEVPDPIVRATAMTALAIMNANGTGGGVKMIAAGGSRIERFSASFLDDDVKRLLEPFQASLLF